MDVPLLEALKRPALYKQSEAAFWDDPYISNQMLKAHLNPECDAASRNLSFIERSAAWIREVLDPRLYPTLLDIGCGPGLYAERFARSGYQVTGIDCSRRSIGYALASAQANKLDITYRYQNYLHLTEPQSYDVCTLIYCDYGALSVKDRATVMRNVFACLKPGAMFLFDVFTKQKLETFKEEQTWQLCEGNGFWRSSRYLEITAYSRYSDSVSLRHITIATDTETTPYYIWDTYFDEAMITEEAKSVGFMVCGLYGDVTGEPLTEGSETMAVLLKKASELTSTRDFS